MTQSKSTLNNSISSVRVLETEILGKSLVANAPNELLKFKVG